MHFKHPSIWLVLTLDMRHYEALFLLTAVFPGPCYSLQIIEEETDAQWGEQLVQGHTVLEAPESIFGCFLSRVLSLPADMVEFTGTEFLNG